MQIIDGIIKNFDDNDQANIGNQSSKILSGSEFLNFLQSLDNGPTENKTLVFNNLGEGSEQNILNNFGKLLDKHDLSFLTSALIKGEDYQILRELISDIDGSRYLSLNEVNSDKINEIIPNFHQNGKEVISDEISNIDKILPKHNEDYSEEKLFSEQKFQSTGNLLLSELSEKISSYENISTAENLLNKESILNEDLSELKKSVMDEKIIIDEGEEKIDEEIENFSLNEFFDFGQERIISDNSQKIFHSQNNINNEDSLEKLEEIQNFSENYEISENENQNNNLSEETKELGAENNFEEMIQEFTELQELTDIKQKNDNFIKRIPNNYEKFSEANLDKYKIIDQFKVSLENISVNNNKIMIKLYPEELGHVEIELKFNKDIVNNVNIEVANNLTYNILQDEIINIKSLLNNMGFEVNEGKLNLSLNQQQQDQSNQNKKNKTKNKVIDITENVTKHINQQYYYKKIDITV